MESEFIAWLRERLPAHRRLVVGAGDDAALVRLDQGAEILVSVDVLTEGVDFRLDEVAAERVGRKALAVNLSDMAAMAARPVGVVVGVVLPRQNGLRLAQQLADGMIPPRRAIRRDVCRRRYQLLDRRPCDQHHAVFGEPDDARAAVARADAATGRR